MGGPRLMAGPADRELGGPRDELIAAVVGRLPPPVGEDCLRVGIDGVDGAGKSVFARELATALRAGGRPVIEVSADDWHHQRAVRHARGSGLPRASGSTPMTMRACGPRCSNPWVPAGRAGFAGGDTPWSRMPCCVGRGR